MAERRWRFSDLRGLPILDEDGRRLGTLSDLVASRRRDELVVDRLVLMPLEKRSLRNVLRRLARPRTLDARRVCAIVPGTAIRLAGRGLRRG